jgi:hypothetical protein
MGAAEKRRRAAIGVGVLRRDPKLRWYRWTFVGVSKAFGCVLCSRLYSGKLLRGPCTVLVGNHSKRGGAGGHAAAHRPNGMSIGQRELKARHNPT